MAWIVLIGEGAEADEAMAAAFAAKQPRLRRSLTQRPGAHVLYDIQIARELVRDIKQRMKGGKLYVFRVEEPQEVYDATGGETS